jgi:hypothetical protein
MKKLFSLALLMLLVPLSASAASLDGVAVDITNTSEPVLCAEKDNITLNMRSSAVTQFRIEAKHPAYIGAMVKDNFAPDWTACEELTAAGSAEPPADRVTFYESVDVWLTGYKFKNFWRKNNVPFTIGNRTEQNLSMVQLWVRRNERAEEVLVLYPADGYWRIRPLPPAHMGWSAYGSSFLVGPVEVEGRPIVKIKAVAFDVKTMTFTIDFEQGGSARVKIANLDQDRLGLDVQLDKGIEDKPFAAMRSMYVTEFNADVARVAVREAGAKGWREEPILPFKGAKATDLWAGRLVPSHHNTSAPDMIFNSFTAAK